MRTLWTRSFILLTLVGGSNACGTSLPGRDPGGDHNQQPGDKDAGDGKPGDGAGDGDQTGPGDGDKSGGDGDTTPPGHDAGTPGGDGDTGGGDGDMPPTPSTRLIAYLPNYRGSFGDWAKRIDFSKMTHLNLAFANPGGDGKFGIGQSDEEVKALVDAAHKSGTKVLASLGGGGGDQQLADGYTNQNLDDLVNNLDAFVQRLGLDGVDVDMEAPGRMQQEYVDFLDKCVDKFRPQGKLVTAAVAPWIQNGLDKDVSQHMLGVFDFVNVMAYASMDETKSDMDFYEGLGVAKDKLVVGARFFGNSSDNQEVDYSQILQDYPDAWMGDEVHNGGYSIYFTGPQSMAELAGYAKDYGGVMFWELGEDVEGEHSLYKALQDNL